MRIRPLKATELHAMRSVWERAGLPYRPRGRDSMQNLRKQLKENPECFLGAFKSGQMVGAVIVSDDGRKGWVNRLAVVPQARGHGIAKRLIAEAERILRRRGRRLHCVLIESYNKDSMELFEDAGYTREDDILYFTKRELKSY
ncbi:MAG: GNAT family N-acetyltransferase [Candidatus Thermoplasmatota archaeon]|nr:GNAT family N-acetyltransferase [Candidatus Thermoplasmatota archaeon]